MAYFFLFLSGLAIGSFINVLALRYTGDSFLFSPKVIGGRSRCPHCGKILRWFELVPLLSFAVQRGRCRNCRAKIGMHYPLVELLSGAIFAFVPLQLASYPWPFSALWIAAFEILLLVAYIDLRLQIVPDELTVLLGVVAIFETIFAAAYLGSSSSPGGYGSSFSSSSASFFGTGAYAALFNWFGSYGNVWLGHAIGALAGAGFFGLLALATRGRGMGMGDVKLGAPLGFLFGWPDTLPLYAAAFIIGAIVGAALILQKRKTAKSAVPFAPFLVLGAAFVFFFGSQVAQWYFRIIGL